MMPWFFLALLVVLVVWQVRLVLARIAAVQTQRDGEPKKVRKKRLQLEALEPGGTPQNPVEIDSPAVVEPHAVALACSRCGELHRLEEHTALTIDGVRLRKAVVQCRNCGNRRALFFQLRPVLN